MLDKMDEVPKKPNQTIEDLDKIIKRGYEIDAQGKQVKLSKQDLRIHKKTLIRLQIQKKIFL